MAAEIHYYHVAYRKQPEGRVPARSLETALKCNKEMEIHTPASASGSMTFPQRKMLQQFRTKF